MDAEYSIYIFYAIFAGTIILLMGLIVNRQFTDLKDPDVSTFRQFVDIAFSSPEINIMWAILVIIPITLFLFLHGANFLRSR